MLLNLIEDALRLDVGAIEIEYKDGEEWVTAFRGNVGIGIATFSWQEAEPVFEEFKALKRKKVITVAGTDYHLHFRKHESFGELVYRIVFGA